MSHKDYKTTQKKDESDAKKRFFVQKADIGRVAIEGEEHNHLANVMRFGVGNEVILICGDDYDYFGKIVEIKKNFSVVDVTKKELNIANPKIDVTAFVAVNRREPMSLMVRMLSEIGITTFVPIITKWTQGQDAKEKIERYQKIADQSAKQCRRSKTLKVEQTQKLIDICKTFKDFDAVFFAYENEYLKTISNCDIKSAGKIAFLIGPVAGFDTDEAKLIIDSGAISISLGKRILKADTASISIASILMEKYEK